MHSRREIIKNVVLGSIGLSTIPLSRKTGTQLPGQMTVLFQGDSITDAGRDRGRYYANDGRGMGGGYVKHIVTEVLGLNPSGKFRFYNRGISGNKVFQLAHRWNDDCMNLKPDVLSILIGVNDFWHTLSHGYDGTARIYERDLRDLIHRTLEDLPDCKLIIGEPFVLPEGSAIKPDRWKSEFPAYQAAAKMIANDFDAAFIPYQQVFDQALSFAGTDYWCPDGVHPSMAGNYLMANAWLEAFYSLFE